YATRLDFAIEPETEEWLQRDLPFVDSVTGARLRNELMRTLKEPIAPRAMLLARDLGVLTALHPALALSDEVESRWPDVAEERVKLGLCLLLEPPKDAALTSLVERLHLQGEYENGLREVVRLASLSPRLAAAYDDSVTVVTLLDKSPAFAVQALAIRE